MKIKLLLSLLVTAGLLAQTGADLVVTGISASVNTDPQTLASNGSLSVTVRNNGTIPTPTGFQLAVFEDRNGNARYDAATDNLLGTSNVALPLGAGASTNSVVPIQGTVLFRGSILYVWADSNNVVLEIDETNNVRHTGQASVFTSPADTALNPVLKWAAGTFTDLPTSQASLSTPTVGDVNGDGIPDVVFSTYVTAIRANLRVVSGNTGAVILTVTDPNLELAPSAHTSLADIDADGRPEFITIDRLGRVMVLEHDGTLKWRSTQFVPGASTGPLIVDLDRDGTPEIVVGNQVFSATGTRLWAGTGGGGRGYAGLTAGAVADLDLDGVPEVIAGPTAYRENGTVFWNKLNTPVGLKDGPVAIGNFDADPYPEIVIRPYNSTYVYMLEHDGTIKWGVNHAIHQTWGGQPTVGDVDNDGVPEIGIVDRINYILYRADGSILWSIPISEHSSGTTTSVFFDLNNDGRAEIIYADQQQLYILRGSDGTILNQFLHYSTTAAEGPTVADIDLDGHAEILVAADVPFFPEGRGVRAYRGAGSNWANTRPIWNQDNFTVTNANDDLTVPATVISNWLVPGLNHFRTNDLLPNSLTQPGSAADITVSFLRRLDDAFPASTRLIARIGNGGSSLAPVHRVEFRNGPAGPLLGAVNTSRVLRPGEYEDLAIVWAAPPAGQINLVVTADTNLEVTEGDETNNQHASQLVIGQGPFVTVDDLIARGKDASVDLKWTPVPSAVSYNIYRRTSATAAALIRAAHITAAGAFSDAGLTNNTLYLYEVRWLNQQGQESRQGTESSATPIPRTQRGDTPPSLLSSPPTRGRTLSAYHYSSSAADPDAGEVLTWSLTGAPAGMTFSTTNGRMDWTPGASQGGAYRLTLTATDTRNRKASQAFTLFIETQVANSAPQFLSTPLTSGALGRPYAYTARASDADAGEVLTFLLDNGPSGMTINSATGLLQWTPAAVGTFPVSLRVRDLPGANVVQTFSIVVRNLNRGPQITSAPRTTGNANATFSYVAAATDPDAGDTLTWALVTAPTGAVIHPGTGVLLWTPSDGQVGAHPLTIEVRDRIGAIAQQSWTLTISPGVNLNSAPVFTSEALLTGRAGIPYLYDAQASDPEGGIVSFGLTLAPAGAIIDPGSGLISWTPQVSQVGAQNFTVRASDPQGTASTQSFTVTVTDVPPAIFTLISPSPGADLSRPVNIVADITDPNSGGPALTWTVKLRGPGIADRTLASGTGQVTNGTIAVLDPTVIANDTYTIMVDVLKGAEGIHREFPYSVSGDLKLGRFTSTVNDLTIPFVGVPLSITRHYDSLDTRSGDFGAGWRLGLFGSVVDAPTEAPLQGMRTGAKVYVTTPEGRRVGFRFDPFAPAFLFPNVVTPRFTPDAGVQDKLEVAETSVLLFDNVAHSTFNTVWNPRRYILTTKEGVRYELDEIDGVLLIRDRNANTITFTPTAILSSTGVQVALTRDGQGRITSIREPSGAEMRYTYDAFGNLSTTIDQLGNTFRYFYENASFPNFVTKVEDPLGRPNVRNIVDGTGRLAASCPADGDISTLAGCTRLTHNPDALAQTLFNGRGFRRDYTYDDRGNLVTERKYLDAFAFRDTIRTYDAVGNLLSERDPAGNLTSFTYDAAGNILSRTDSAGRRTSYTYNTPCNLVATITDTAGGVESYTYDSLCQLRFVRDRAGQTTEYRYDSAGNQTHLIDPQGAATVRTFTGQGFPATLRDPRGGVATLTWSTTGDLLSRTDRNGRRIDYQYNAAHALTRETWSNGRVIQFNSDSFGLPLSASDASASISFQYNAVGRRTREEAAYPGKAVFALNYTYDANGNRTAAVDSLGGTTQRTFNGLDQLDVLTQSGAGVGNKRVQFDFDLAGLPVTVHRYADLAGSVAVARTVIEYDCGGCGSRTTALRHTNPAGTVGLNLLTFGRNTLGDITQMTDVQGLHLFEYDAARRLTRATHPNPAIQPSELYTYDAAGNRLTSHTLGTHQYSYQGGPGGNLLTNDGQFDYTYDAEGNLSRRRNRTDNSTIDYGYDFRNRVTEIVARNGSGVETGRNTFSYDPLNRRISSVDSAGETLFYYDLLHPVIAIAPSNSVTRRLYERRLDSILAEDVAGQTRWLLTDQVGTVRTVLDNAGAPVSQLLLSTFGSPLQNTNPAVASQLSFTGRETIPVSGDLFFRARLYSPAVGRFVQADPVAPFSYDYALNSPLVSIDPLGLNTAPEYTTLSSRLGVRFAPYAKATCTALTGVLLVAAIYVGNPAAASELIDAAEAISLVSRKKMIDCP
ncbi:putative Ig domain-containing protein [Paludibaculum fermentans]|uniref:putative Ig domain-containing protein n=1 Tax=Paludibaculum fermentans TaxID=1473598 RepID=UPI003EBD9F58